MQVVQSTKPYRRFIVPKFSNQRKINYAGVKSFVRNGLGLDTSIFEVSVIGERQFDQYKEPSPRWDDAIRNVLRIGRTGTYHIVLGVSKSLVKGESVVKLQVVRDVAEWQTFKQNYCVLMLALIWRHDPPRK